MTASGGDARDRAPVGRDGVRHVLHAAVERTSTGPGSFVVLAGEPGIGKTTLLSDAAAHARRVGARVAWGWGWPGDGAPAHWPWRQVLRELGLAEPVADDRFQLFDEICSGLLAESRVQPLVVVLDDLHWADESSLRLLEFLARRLPAGAMTILGAQRDVAAPPAGALVIPLRGLSVAAIGELIGDPKRAELIQQRTGGNPFLAQQVMWLNESGIPPGAAQMLAERIDGLDLEVLAVAAAIGLTFTTALLATILPDQEVDAATAQAAKAGVIVQTGPGEFRFAHDLFREYAAQATTAGTHRRIAERLVETTADPAEIAAHFVLADPCSPEAYEWSVRAAEAADHRLAYEDAVRHWRNAPASIHTLLGSAHAQRKAGDLDAARDTFLAATRLSRAADDGDGLAEAALGLHALGSRPLWPAGELVALLTEAQSCPTAGTRLRVAAALARTLAWHGIDAARAQSLAEDAVAQARALGDAAVLAECLLALHNVSWLPGRAAQRYEIATAIDGELVVEAHLLAATDLLELGDPRFRGELDEFVRLARASAQPRLRYAAVVRQGMLAMLAGKLGEAERFIQNAYHLGTECGEPAVEDVYTDQLWRLRTQQGRLGELVDTAPAFHDPRSTPALGFRALALLAAGRREEAEAVIAPVFDRAPTPSPGHNSLLNLVFATQLTVALGHQPTAKWLYEAFEPYAGTTVVSGAAISFHGAVDYHLAALATLLGRTADAQRHSRDARDIHERLGAQGWNMPVAQGKFRREGPVWTLEFAGQAVKLKDSKGLRDLAVLLSSPAREISASDLLGTGPTMGADDVLDEQARQQIRARLLDLEEDIAEAEEWADPERAARARDERDAILRELASSLGLGGRSRRLGDESERARKAVTARIRDAIGRVHAIHPALGDHLSACVTTGTSCCYLPATPVSWRI